MKWCVKEFIVNLLLSQIACHSLGPLNFLGVIGSISVNEPNFFSISSTKVQSLGSAMVVPEGPVHIRGKD